MTACVAIIAPGQMGSAVARRLADHGVRVLTVLDGRSAESIRRAGEAGMISVSLPELEAADVMLSIVPPGEAVGLAQHFVAALADSRRKPLFVDCNAINPGTAETVSRILRSGDIDCVDGGIIGGPPKRGYDGPVFYLSGERAGDAARLSDHGLNCRILDAGPYAASALKMSYAGITKGLTALASMMILGASRAGVAEGLRLELAQSQPMLLAWFDRQIPSMFPKAYRWIAEMEEIAEFLHEDSDAEALFSAVANFYSRMADAEGLPDARSLSGFFEAGQQSATPTRLR